MNPFDQMASQWDANPAHLERTQAIAQAIRRHVPLSREMRAIEVGAGTGLLSLALQPDLGPITLTDTSEGMLEVLRTKIAALGLTTLHPQQIDLAVDTLPPASYELAYLQMVLHHIPDVAGFLSRLLALLAPGGYLCVADLVEEDGSFHGTQLHGAEFHGHHGFDPEALAQQAAALGFEGGTHEIVYQMRREGQDRLFPVFLLTARKPR